MSFISQSEAARSLGITPGAVRKLVWGGSVRATRTEDGLIDQVSAVDIAKIRRVAEASCRELSHQQPISRVTHESMPVRAPQA
jgi:hypothetical protein